MEVMVSMSALAPSVYRKYVKGWDKGRYADVFKKFAKGNAYRVYIPVGAKSSVAIEAPPSIVRILEEKGYTVEDYRAGVALHKDGKRRMRIGRMLTSDPKLKQAFDNDPARKAYKSQYIICISRHPYDIVGSSTNRGWTSCMNLDDGENRHYVAEDVKLGTIIAYLIDQHDMNITRPTGRVLIKPFYKETQKGRHVVRGTEMILRCEGDVYGTTVDSFVETVQDWLDKNFNHGVPSGHYRMDRRLYADGDHTHIHMDENDPEFWKRVNDIKSGKAARYSEESWTYEKSEERMAFVATHANALGRLEFVTVDDILTRLKRFPMEAVDYVLKHKDGISGQITKDRKGVRTDTKIGWRRVLRLIAHMLKKSKQGERIYGEFDRVFKFSEDDITSLLIEDSDIFQYVDQSRMDVRKFSLGLFQYDKINLADIYDGIKDRKLAHELIELWAVKYPNILAEVAEPPIDLILTPKYWKKVGSDFLDNHDIAELSKPDLMKVVECAVNSDQRRYVLEHICDNTSISGDEDFMRFVDGLMQGLSKPDWMDLYFGDTPLIKNWSDEFIIHTAQRNPSIMMQAVWELEGRRHLVTTITKANPLLFFDQYGSSEIAEYLNDQQFAFDIIDALEAVPRITQKPDFWQIRPFNYMQMTVLSVRMNEKKNLFPILDRFMQKFGDAITLGSKRERWGTGKILLSRDKALAKWFAENWPAVYVGVPLSSSNTLVDLRFYASLVAKGTPKQMRAVNGFVAEAKKLLEAKTKKTAVTTSDRSKAVAEKRKAKAAGEKKKS